MPEPVLPPRVCLLSTVTPQDQAFADALVAQSGWLRQLVRRLIDDRDAADDVCQTTLLQAWRHRPSTDRGLRPWLATVARRLTTRQQKREAIRPALEGRAAGRDTSPSTSDVVERMAWQQNVVSAVMRLEEPYRTTLLMRFWENAPPRKVAEHFGIPVETVRTRIKRGLARVRAELDEEHGSRQAWVTAVLPLAEYSAAGIAMASILATLMTKKLTLGAAGALAAIALFALSNTFGSDDPIDSTQDSPAVIAAELARDDAEAEVESLAVAPVRDVVRTASFTDDPDIRAALCGFVGRIVFGDAPIEDCGVRLYRISMDAMIETTDRRFGRGDAAPIHHFDTRTDSDGRFHIDGSWPRGTFLLHYGRGTEHPTFRMLEHAPGPGQLVDLGTLELAQSARVSGRVVDEDGQPIGDAEVIGGDIPAASFAMFPIDRLSRDSVALVRREGFAPVIQPPTWFRDLFDELPVSRTRTDEDGRFELTGLPPGKNIVIARASGFSTAAEHVPLSVGEARVVGDLTIDEGEELFGTVVDSNGDPVSGAEVLAGPTSIVPIDVARSIGTTDENGEFSAAGFPRGRVTVAVRRHAGDPWHLLEPRPIDQDIDVVLPATHTVTLRVVDTSGSAVSRSRVRALVGERRSSTTMERLGFDPSIDLGDRLKETDTGEFEIRDLKAGSYVFVVSADGFGTKYETYSVPAEAEIEITLEPSPSLEVFVHSAAGPVRNASVFLAVHTDLSPATNVQSHCGYTDEAGLLTIDDMDGARLVIAALHPAFGTVDVLADRDQGRVEILLQDPGRIIGTFRPADPTEDRAWAVTLHRDRNGPLGMIDATPQHARVASNGTFEFRGLQPGKYEVRAIPSFGAHVSIGSFVRRADEWFGGQGPSRLVDIEPGATVNVELGARPTAASGEAEVEGRLEVDHQPGSDYRIQLIGSNGPVRDVTTDAAGIFKLTKLPAGNYHLDVKSPDGSVEVWNEWLTLDPGEVRELAIAFETTRLEGVVVDAAGAPVPGASVRLTGSAAESQRFLSAELRADAFGRFVHEQLVPGRFSLRATADGPSFSASESVAVHAQLGSVVTGIELVVHAAPRVTGRVDLRAFGIADPTGVKLALHRVEQPAPDTTWEMHSSGDWLQSDGSFEFERLVPCTYRLVLEHETRGPIAKKRLVVGRESMTDIAFDSLPDWIATR